MARISTRLVLAVAVFAVLGWHAQPVAAWSWWDISQGKFSSPSPCPLPTPFPHQHPCLPLLLPDYDRAREDIDSYHRVAEQKVLPGWTRSRTGFEGPFTVAPSSFPPHPHLPLQICQSFVHYLQDKLLDKAFDEISDAVCDPFADEMTEAAATILAGTGIAEVVEDPVVYVASTMLCHSAVDYVKDRVSETEFVREFPGYVCDELGFGGGPANVRRRRRGGATPSASNPKGYPTPAKWSNATVTVNATTLSSSYTAMLMVYVQNLTAIDATNPVAVFSDGSIGAFVSIFSTTTILLIDNHLFIFLHTVSCFPDKVTGTFSCFGRRREKEIDPLARDTSAGQLVLAAQASLAAGSSSSSSSASPGMVAALAVMGVLVAVLGALCAVLLLRARQHPSAAVVEPAEPRDDSSSELTEKLL